MSEGKNYIHNELEIRTVDNVTIRGSLYKSDNDKVIIYCHRLLGSQSGEEVQRLSEAFIDEYDLITFNFRGHKSSGMISSTGGDEILDLRAVLSFAVKRGYENIIVIGAGMGGSVAIRTAGIFRNIDALAVVSPSGFSPKLQPFVIKLVSDISLNTDFGRVPLRILTNTRLGPRYTAGYPVDVAAGVSQIPLFVVQSKDDRLADLDNIRAAFNSFPEPKEMLVVEGNKHAGDLLAGDVLTGIRDWLKDVFPERRNPAEGRAGSVRIELTGDLPVPEELLQRDLHDRLNGAASSNFPIDAEIINRHLIEALSLYGYTKAALAVTGSAPAFSVRISIPKIDSVSIEENKWVKEYYIRRILEIDGDYYNSYELDTAVRRLSAEPAISTAASEVTESNDGSVHLRINVTEQKPYRLLLSTKFTDIDKFYGVGFTWNEFNPSGIQLEGMAAVGVFDRDLLTSFGAAKNIWRNGIRLGGKYFDNIKSRDDLDYVYTRQEVHEIGGEVSARYQMTSTISINLGVFGKEFKSPEVTSDFPVEEGTAIGNSLKLDVGGKLPLQGEPRFNWRHTFYYQNSGFRGRGDFNFSTYQLNFTGDLKLWRRHLSVTTFHYGWLSGEAPPQEHFSLGGMTTLPGYADDSFVNTRMIRISQAIYISAGNWVDATSLLSPLRFVATFNAGTVWGNDEKFEASDLKMDAGLEIDYDEVLRLGISAPVGPHRVQSPRVYIGWGIHVW